MNYGVYRGPWNNAYGHRFIVVYRQNAYIEQIGYDNLEIRIRRSANSGETWTDWSTIPTNIPSFYKDYASLAALATGLGVNTYTLPSTTNTIDISIGYGLIYVGDPNTGGYGLFSVSFGSVRKIASVYDEHYTVTRKDSATVTLTYPDTHNSEVFIKLLKF